MIGTSAKVRLIRSGDLVLYRRIHPSFIHKAIRFGTMSDTEHVEVVGKRGEELMVANAHPPAMTIDRFCDRVEEVERGELRMIVIRWTPFTEREREYVFQNYQQATDLALELLEKIPPYYDVYSLAVIGVNVLKRVVRTVASDKWNKRLKQSTKNWEHAVYCSELADIICEVCGHFKMLAGLPPQTHSAPVHLERQLRAGRFKVIADFGDLSSFIFRVNLT